MATRAQTSRPVLARRRPTREALVIAAIRHNDERHQPPIPDTGSLRGDLIAVLKGANQHRLLLIAPVLAQIGGYPQETGRTPGSTSSTSRRASPRCRSTCSGTRC